MQIRVYIGQEKILRITVGLRQLRLKIHQHVQLGIKGLCFIQVIPVPTAPVERLTGNTLQSGGIDVALLQKSDMLFRKVFPYNRYQRHIGEKAGRSGKIGGRAPQNVISPAERGLYSVKRDGTDNNNAHWILPPKNSTPKYHAALHESKGL